MWEWRNCISKRVKRREDATSVTVKESVMDGKDGWIGGYKDGVNGRLGWLVLRSRQTMTIPSPVAGPSRLKKPIRYYLFYRLQLWEVTEGYWGGACPHTRRNHTNAGETAADAETQFDVPARAKSFMFRLRCDVINWQLLSQFMLYLFSCDWSYGLFQSDFFSVPGGPSGVSVRDRSNNEQIRDTCPAQSRPESDLRTLTVWQGFWSGVGDGELITAERLGGCRVWRMRLGSKVFP